METTQAVSTGAVANIKDEPLKEAVARALQNYFDRLEGFTPANLYNMVLEEVEIPLLEIVLRFTRGNQSRAAILLGISRGTLRKKLKQYNIIN